MRSDSVYKGVYNIGKSVNITVSIIEFARVDRIEATQTKAHI